MTNKIEKRPDGQIDVELETGERFSGDPLEVTTKMAEAHVSTKKWGAEWKQKAEAPPAATTPNATPQSPADANEAQLQSYLLTQTAKALGYGSADEYKADLAKVKGTVSEVSKSNALQQFFTQHPEFPGTPEANDAIGKIFDEKGWNEMTADNLHFAHLEAIHRHGKDPKQGYEPLSSEAVNSAWANQMSAANRQAAPPMLRGNNPELSGTNQDAWTMPLADLRKAAIQQELSRK